MVVTCNCVCNNAVRVCSENSGWFKKRFDVHIGSRHQLKCALVFDSAQDLEAMHSDAQELFKGVDLCPGLMMFQT